MIFIVMNYVHNCHTIGFGCGDQESEHEEDDLLPSTGDDVKQEKELQHEALVNDSDQEVENIVEGSEDHQRQAAEEAHDKGYRGYSRNKMNNTEIMHGSGTTIQQFGKTEQVGSTSGYSSNNANIEEEDNDQMHGGVYKVAWPMRSDRKEGDDIVDQQVLAMSANEIAQHLLVMKMIERLATLEGHHNVVFAERNDGAMQQLSKAEDIDSGDSVGSRRKSNRMEVSS